MQSRKIAVVTGAGSGIGVGVATMLAADGYGVAVVDVNRAAAEKTAQQIVASGGDAHAYAVDVTRQLDLEAARREIETRQGTPFAVVNNVGWSVIERFVDTDIETWRKAIEINLTSTIAVTRTFLDGMMAVNDGAVVNIASDAGRVGSTGEVVYSAAKGGVIAFTKALAREVARHSIRVNCVCPGPTTTPMLLVQDQNRIEALTRAIPFKRLASPEDIAGAVAYLLSQRASYVTGQVVSVSGGLTMAG